MKANGFSSVSEMLQFKDSEISVSEKTLRDDSGMSSRQQKASHKFNEKFKIKRKASDVEFPFQGIETKSIASVNIPTEDVGHALQFLEFCVPFRGNVTPNRLGKVLQLVENVWG